MLIAFANVCRKREKIDFQHDILFVGKDIDPVVAKMCYIQISLLGCPGYIVIGNTLTEPFIDKPENVWHTPMWHVGFWQYRTTRDQLDIKEEPKEENVIPKIEKKEERPVQQKPKPVTIQKKPVKKRKSNFSILDFFTKR